MTPFEKYLIEVGFVAYRNSDKGFVRCNNPGFYSTMPSDGVYYLDTIFKRDKNIIWYGHGFMPRGNSATIKHLGMTLDETINFERDNPLDIVLSKCIETMYEYDAEYLNRFQ